MAKKKKNRFSKFFILLLIGATAYWIWKGPSQPKKSSSTPVEIPTSLPSKTEGETKLGPGSKAIPSIKPLLETFPKQAWLDDYLQIPLNSQLLLMGIGLAPDGKNPDQILNPDQLHPALLVLKKEGDHYLKKDEFNFSTSEPTEAGISGNDLRGIPRIKPENILFLDSDKSPELRVSIDTTGEWTEAVAFLKWKNAHLEWVKTRDSSGKEKLALWLQGSTATESQEILIRKDPPTQRLQVIQKKGVLDSAHPENGFIPKIIVWEMRDGVLQEK